MAASWPSPDEHDRPDDPPSGAEAPWTADPDAWQAETPATVPTAPPSSPFAPLGGGCWPQLDAGPLYWMWLERLEEEQRRAA